MQTDLCHGREMHHARRALRAERKWLVGNSGWLAAYANEAICVLNRGGIEKNGTEVDDRVVHCRQPSRKQSPPISWSCQTCPALRVAGSLPSLWRCLGLALGDCNHQATLSKVTTSFRDYRFGTGRHFPSRIANMMRAIPTKCGSLSRDNPFPDDNSFPGIAGRLSLRQRSGYSPLRHDLGSRSGARPAAAHEPGLSSSSRHLRIQGFAGAAALAPTKGDFASWQKS
jgi:hypothetical protein